MFLFPSLCGPVYRPAGVRQQATDAPHRLLTTAKVLGKPTQKPPSALDRLVGLPRHLAGGKALKVGSSWTDQVVRLEATGEFSKVGRIFFLLIKTTQHVPRRYRASSEINSHKQSAEMCVLVDDMRIWETIKAALH